MYSVFRAFVYFLSGYVSVIQIILDEHIPGRKIPFYCVTINGFKGTVSIRRAGGK
jgi:hypothetical protein